MLRVEFQDTAKAIVIRMEGRFVGRFAEDLRELVVRCRIPSVMLVNLSVVTLIDPVGEGVLIWLSQIGVKFIAQTDYALAICERLNLPLLRKRAWAARHRV